MIEQTQLNTLSGYIQSSQSVVVFFKAGASQDELACVGALTDALRISGKEVIMASSRKIPGLDQVVTELGNQNLCVSFEYNEQAVDKVSYHISEDSTKFFLTIKPKKGAQPLDARTVEYSYTGFETDLIILVGITSLDMLEQLYYGYEDVFKNTATVTLTTSPTSIGHLSLSSVGTSSLSEFAADLLQSLNMDITPNTATELLAGIEQETENLQSLRATATTFEVVARLLRLGARRTRASQPQVIQPVPTVEQPGIIEVEPEFDAETESTDEGEPLAKQKKKPLQRLQVTTKRPQVRQSQQHSELGQPHQQQRVGSLKYTPSKNQSRNS